MQIEPLNSWLSGVKRPIVIAGPCSAETEVQVLDVAQQLRSSGVALFRAGIWKPRTRPGAFEGVGSVGLKWLQKAKEETGIKTTVEVATASHVEQCLKHDVDVLWIGARSTANPFTVQEIADALKGVDIPVMIKNPVNPDLNLWIGAIERIQKAGINKIAAIHRGFSAYKLETYRNDPMWEIPIELMRQIPELPIICDPSHITGNRNLVSEIAQRAMDMEFDGLMIETHIDPENAWSDAAQQVTPDSLKSILDSLILRRKSSDDSIFNANLEQFRVILDKLDEELVRKLKERLKIVEEVGELKKEQNITILQPERWNQVYLTRTEWAQELGLSPDIVLKIFQSIHQESIRKQTEVMNRSTEQSNS